jgi:hypothetical protein
VSAAIARLREQDADYAWENPDLSVEALEPEMDRANRRFLVNFDNATGMDLGPLYVDFDEVRRVQYGPNRAMAPPLHQMRRDQREAARRMTPREALDEIIERQRDREERWLREAEADTSWRSDSDYEDMARQDLEELGGSGSFDQPAEYRKYIDEADPTYHEFVLRGEHPDFEEGSVGHFGDDGSIVAHILANKGRILEMQSDAAQNALSDGLAGNAVPNLLHPRSSEAQMMALKGYLQWAAENQMLRQGDSLEFPMGAEVARRWGQPTGPVTLRGAKLRPVENAEDLPGRKGEPVFELNYDTDHPWASRSGKRLLRSKLGTELGENAALLTREILEKGGELKFPTPVVKEMGLKSAYDTVLPNAINNTFKKYGVEYGPDRKIKITPELWKAMTEGEFSPYRKGGHVAR